MISDLCGSDTTDVMSTSPGLAAGEALTARRHVENLAGLCFFAHHKVLWELCAKQFYLPHQHRLGDWLEKDYFIDASKSVLRGGSYASNQVPQFSPVWHNWED